jgi:hypothetical protein
MKNHRPFISIAAAMIILGSIVGCAQFFKERPDIAQVFTESPDLASEFKVADSGINWEHFSHNLESNEAQLRRTLGSESYDIIRQASSQAAFIESVSICIDTIPLPSEQNSNVSFEDQDWLVGVNIKVPVPALILEEAINRNTGSAIKLVKQDPVDGFERFHVVTKDGDELVCEMLLWSRENAQIRLGSTEALLGSVDRIVDTSFVRFDSMEQDAKGWVQVSTPEPLLDFLTNLENQTPFQAGTLLSGLNAWAASYSIKDEIFSATNSFFFEDSEQASTAFSYLQLSTSLAIKPLLRTVLGKKAHFFVRSIKNNLSEDRISNNFMMSENDLEALKEYAKQKEPSGQVEVLLNLIHTES